MDELRILSPTAILGYGFPVESFKEGLKREPHVIAVDAGSTDPGPYYLGAGVSFTNRGAVKRDLEFLLEAAVSRKIPLLIGTSGGSGGRPHLQRDVELVREIARERGLHFRLALVHAEVDRERVRKSLRSGKVHPLGPAQPLTEEDLDASARIVGQMGVEPLIGALDAGADVVLAGRAYDPAVFAAQAIRRGFDPGLAIHLGKILECGAIAASPGSGSDSLLGILTESFFEVEPLNPQRRCTVSSVAAHTLYEKADPVLLPGPGGCLNLKKASFEQVSESRVRVTGSSFIPSDSYCVKLEGVRKAGYRTISLAGCRDPVMVREIDYVLDSVRERVRDNFSHVDDYFLDFKLYGRNGVMGNFERNKETTCHELGILIEAIAGTQELADTICGFARSTMLHCSYPGRVATAGNLAFPFSPSDFRGGEVYRFSIYHLMEVDDPFELFPLEIMDI
ncbi:MAG TPA: acyclic terpene utilization AtuA family protein [Bacillota bacterium]|nr:acyclic terpene utilization AtuA family protein [Peptococcaceae bacterium MAG4]NLW38129.1 DUF1446 domain-containing protein [Peptococcaceae bacterium]HPZ43038.1 acyclic terpene utilization AtuA family protein [Bacillota bacterium]HQD75567.1 acyclic terpene utilization AtuA family protein [Bacillota bacterium]HUM57818.1 acyclic terpene utilization AtuA family protein [Bacillota bacterium]